MSKYLQKSNEDQGNKKPLHEAYAAIGREVGDEVDTGNNVFQQVTKEQMAIRTTLFSILSGFCLAIIKGLSGYFGNSFALIADAIESMTDVVASFLVFLGIKYSLRPPDRNHPYGHGRVEPLMTFLVVGFLIISASVIAYEGINNIGNPHEMPKAWTLPILAGIIIWKEISFRFVMRRSRETNSSALMADAWNHRSDAITSVAAFAGICVALLLGAGYEAADDWAALFAAGLIIYNSYRILRPALGEIMDENVYDELIEKIRQVALCVEGISGTEKCFIRKSGIRFHVDLHAHVDGKLSVRSGHDLAHRLSARLKRDIPELGQILIHIEPD